MDVKDLKADASDAFQKAQLYYGELADIYRFFMPFRQSTVEQATDRGGQSEGNTRTNHLFEGSGLSAAFNFAGTMQADWMPPFEDFFKLEAGPLIPDGDDKKKLNEDLASITNVAHGVLPTVRLSAHEMFLDLFAGTGAMIMGKGDDANPVEALAVPPCEVAMINGPWGRPEGIFWKKNYVARHIEALWPDGKFSDEMAKLLKDNNRKNQIEIVQGTYFERKETGPKKWKLRVWASRDNENAVFHEEEFRTSRWVNPRFFLVPGETMGRGLAHLGLPFVKTANKTRELALTAAAFAIIGIWMRRNDGVFNPDTAVMQPGAMWAVGTTGGPLGASIQRLPVPQDFDVSSIVMADEREQINRVLLNDELPSEQDPIRSPTEIAARLRRYARNKGGTGSRIAAELVAPIVQNTLDILETSGKLPTNLKIDQLLTQCRVTAPAAAAQRSEKVERVISYIQMITMMFGAEAALLILKIEELLPDIGRWMNVDERYIREKTEVDKLKDLIAKAIAAGKQQEAAASAPPAAPGAQYVNGGAM